MSLCLFPPLPVTSSFCFFFCFESRPPCSTFIVTLPAFFSAEEGTQARPCSDGDAPPIDGIISGIYLLPVSRFCCFSYAASYSSNFCFETFARKANQ